MTNCKDKFPSIFSHQMESIVFIILQIFLAIFLENWWKSLDILQFSFSQVMRLDWPVARERRYLTDFKKKIFRNGHYIFREANRKKIFLGELESCIWRGSIESVHVTSSKIIKVSSRAGIRGTEFISVYNFPVAFWISKLQRIVE